MEIKQIKMKQFAIKILATGEIIKQNESLSVLVEHSRVNPTHILVKKSSKGKWINYPWLFPKIN